MLIKILLHAKDCQTVADFRKREESVLKFSYFLLGLGLFTLAFAFLGVPALLKANARPDFFQGFYGGVGCAVIGCAIGIFIRTRRVLKDAAKLKTAFVKATDERSAAIGAAAMQAAAIALLALLYVGLLIAGLFYPVLFWFCFACVTAFCLLMAGFKLYFEKKM